MVGREIEEGRGEMVGREIEEGRGEMRGGDKRGERQRQRKKEG